MLMNMYVHYRTYYRLYVTCLLKVVVIHTILLIEGCHYVNTDYETEFKLLTRRLEL